MKRFLKKRVAVLRAEANATNRFAGYEYVDPKADGGAPSLATALDFEQGAVYQAQYEVFKVNLEHNCPTLVGSMQEH
jgi:hypothetical protein